MLIIVVVRLVVTVGNVSIIISCIDCHEAAVAIIVATLVAIIIATLVAMVGGLKCLVSNAICSFTQVWMLI